MLFCFYIFSKDSTFNTNIVAPPTDSLSEAFGTNADTDGSACFVPIHVFESISLIFGIFSSLVPMRSVVLPDARNAPVVASFVMKKPSFVRADTASVLSSFCIIIKTSFIISVLYSTVTDFARFLGLSGSRFLIIVIQYAKYWNLGATANGANKSFDIRQGIRS